jgi:TfoX/Sxy family transcriptional regulator of competence genes
MAYDEALAERIRSAVGRRAGATEKKMFGGIAFLLDGKTFCGVVGDDLMVRVGPELHEQALAAPHARPMDFTGRPMKGYVFVGPPGTRTETAVRKWVERATTFVAGLMATARRPRPRSGKRPTRRGARAHQG